MRLDSRREEDKILGPHCEFRQNGLPLAVQGQIYAADENLGVILVIRMEEGLFVRDGRNQFVLDRIEGPVEIRLHASAPPEIAKLYRERRLQEQQR